MVSIQRRGKRVGMSLETGNRDAAARRAMEMFEYVRANGWEAGLAKYRPAMHRKGADPTVGEFIEAVRATSSINKPTLETYFRALRRLAADIAGVERGPSMFDMSQGGREAWLQAVGRVKLSALTAKEIQKWKQDFTAKAGQDPISQHSARVSLNSVIRSCKSLWSPKKVLRHLELDVPASPFKEVEYEKAPPRKYSPSFDVAVLLQAAQAELAAEAPEQYKIFLLALAAGLRRKEIDLLEWPAFKWQRNVIAIEATKYLSPKTPGSAQEIKLHPDTMAIFKGFHAKRTGSFVIEADAEPRVGLLAARATS
jgi:integrase